MIFSHLIVDNPSDGRTAVHLAELEECRGLLQSVFVRDGFAVAGFAWGAVSFPEELEERLRELIGREVACLRLDGKFHIRNLGEEGEDHAAR